MGAFEGFEVLVEFDGLKVGEGLFPLVLGDFAFAFHKA